MYIVTTSKITSPNSYLSWSLPTIILQVLLLVFFHFLLIRDIIQTSLFTPKYNIASSQAHDFAIDLNKLQSTLKAEISVP